MVKKNVLVLTGIFCLGLWINGFAQTEEEQGIVDLSPVVITASRIEKKLLEVPGNVSVISQKEIKNSNAKSVTDLLKDLEGIYVYDASGVGLSGKISMRGFVGGMSTYELILVDGIPQNKGKDKIVDWSLISLDNVERIEVVRGAVSALYGDNAMSGVINIITKRPKATETKITASYGSYSTQNYNMSRSDSFNRLGYYIGASGWLTDGFRKYCDRNNISFNGKLDYFFSDAQKVKLALDYQKENSGSSPWALTETQIQQDRSQSKPDTENDERGTSKINMNVTHSWNINKVSDIEETFYYWTENEKSFYTSGSTEKTTTEKLGDENTYGLFLRFNTNPEIFGIKQLFIAGIDLEKNDVDYWQYAAPYHVRGGIQNDYQVGRNKIGHYVQDEVKVFEFLKFTAGIRYDLVNFSFTDNINNNKSKKREMSKLTPRCGIVYLYKEDSNLYLNYANSFRTPTIDYMFTYTTANPDLNPEEATNYELGWHHRFGDLLKTNVSLYWIKLDNEIKYDSNTKKSENYGKTLHQGVETGLDFKIIEGLTGFVNYAYTDAKNENGTYESKYLTMIPIHKGSFGLKGITKFGLKTNLVVTRVGDCYLDSTNDNKLPGFTTVDTKISYGIGWCETFLSIDNLLGETYNSYGYVSSGTKYFTPAPGRTFTCGLEVKF